MPLSVNDLEDRIFLAGLPGMTRLELDYVERHKHRFRASLEILSKIDYDSVLDIGCGRGIFLLLLGEKGTGLAKEEEVAVCRKRGILAYAHELEHGALPFHDRRFDLAVCLEVLEHIRNRERLMREIFRVLKIGGRILISTPNSRFVSWALRDLIITMPWGSRLYYRDSKLNAEKDVSRYSADTLGKLLARNNFRTQLTGYARILLPNDDIIMLASKEGTLAATPISRN